MTTQTLDQMALENEELRCRLEEAEEALRALRAGEVDAVLVQSDRDQVYTLETADKPYRLLVEQMPQAAATLTVDGTILYCNRRFADLLGGPLQALAGKPIHGFIAPASQPRFDALLCSGLETEVRDEFILQRSDGGAVPVYLGVSALREGALGLCLMVTDLTEQRHYQELQRTQEALRQSQAQLSKDLAAAEWLQEISSRLIQQGDVEQLYNEILEAAMEIMHSDMATMQRVDEREDALRMLACRGFEPELPPSFDVVPADAQATCSVARRRGQRVVAPDLEQCDFMAGTPMLEVHRQLGIRAVQSTPLVSRDGRLLGMISTHWQTPHEPAERELRLLDVLARQAADLIERKRAEDALREADRKKDEFLATLAHELRNPLAPIRHAVQILKAPSPPAAERQWAAEVIDRQVQLMARLLEDLLDVSRISRNRMELRMECVELSAVLDAALETSRPLIDASGHRLSVDLPPEPIALEADAVRLAQVFSNLLNNAAKYSEAGGAIDVTAERRGGDVFVSVKDRGIGIAAETLPRIFEIFSQAKPAVARSQEGLGIGLSLVKGLVELHGGSIEARSPGVGQGSEFIVRLPVAAASPVAQPAPPTEDALEKNAKQCRVLIVDDNQDSADTLAMLMQLMGNEIHTAYDGEQAVRMAAELQPDVVLLDIGMPKLNGYDACRRIRQQPGGEGILMIALTGWGQEEDRRCTEEAGFDHHLVKPVSPATLAKLLASR